MRGMRGRDRCLRASGIRRRKFGVRSGKSKSVKETGRWVMASPREGGEGLGIPEVRRIKLGGLGVQSEKNRGGGKKKSVERRSPAQWEKRGIREKQLKGGGKFRRT